MIDIIKHGAQAVRFECEYCDCHYMATAEDYEIGQKVDAVCYLVNCDCPECGMNNEKASILPESMFMTSEEKRQMRLQKILRHNQAMLAIMEKENVSGYQD